MSRFEILLLVCLLALITVGVLPTQAYDVRVLVVDWLSDYGEGNVSFDAEQVTGIGINFMLAAEHFNQRRYDILPALAGVQSCGMNISIVKYCDEMGNGRRTSQIVGQEFAGRFDVMAGLVSLVAADAGAFAALNYPVVSHWASSTKLEDTNNYPSMRRTFISDSAYVRKLANFVKNVLKASHVVCLFMDKDNSPDLKNDFERAMVRENVDVYSIQIAVPPALDETSALKTLGRIKATDRTIIVSFIWLEVIDIIAPLAHYHGLNSSEHVWVFSNIDTNTDLSSARNDAVLANFLDGSFYVTSDVTNSSAFNAYVDLFATEFDTPGHIQAAQEFFPPHGNASGDSCANEAVDLTISPTFFQDIITVKNNVWASAYDTIIAIGMAACAADPSGTAVTPQELHDKLATVSFVGMSGLVQFDVNSNSRNENTTTFKVYNWRYTNGNLSLINLYQSGIWNTYSQSWDMDTTSVRFRSGSSLVERFQGADFVKPNVDYQFLPISLRYLGYAETAICMLVALLGFGFIQFNRDTKVIRASQPFFVNIVMFGAGFAAFSIIGLTVDDNPEKSAFADFTAACMIVPFFFFVGFQIVFGAMIAKTLRLYYALVRTSYRYQSFRFQEAMQVLLACVAIDLILLGIWKASFSLVGSRIASYFDIHGQVTVSYFECNASDPGAAGILISVIAFHMLSLGALFIAANRTRNKHDVSLKLIDNESRWITLLTTALVQASIVAIPSAIAVYRNVIGRFIVLSSFVVFSILATVFFIIYPKIKFVREERERERFATLMNKAPTVAGGGVGGHGNDIPDLLEALRITAVQTRFGEYAERSYITESFHFLMDAVSFEKEFPQQANQANVGKASAMMDIYIRTGSLLEVNISDLARKALEDRFEQIQKGKEVLHADLFGLAVKEINHFVTFGAWMAFVQEGGMYNIRRGSSANDREKSTPRLASVRMKKAQNISRYGTDVVSSEQNVDGA